MAFEGNGNVVFFDGSYSEYAADKEKRLGKKEHFKYKKLGL